MAVGEPDSHAEAGSITYIISLDEGHHAHGRKARKVTQQHRPAGLHDARNSFGPNAGLCRLSLTYLTRAHTLLAELSFYSPFQSSSEKRSRQAQERSEVEQY